MHERMTGEPAENTADALLISLKPLRRMEAKLAARILLDGTPAGTSAIGEALSVRLEGQRLSGSLTGAAADWMILSQDNLLGLIDVRCTIRTDDGALIYIQYNGRLPIMSAQGRNRAYIAPRFETGGTAICGSMRSRPWERATPIWRLGASRSSSTK